MFFLHQFEHVLPNLHAILVQFVMLYFALLARQCKRSHDGMWHCLMGMATLLTCPCLRLFGKCSLSLSLGVTKIAKRIDSLLVVLAWLCTINAATMAKESRPFGWCMVGQNSVVLATTTLIVGRRIDANCIDGNNWQELAASRVSGVSTPGAEAPAAFLCSHASAPISLAKSNLSLFVKFWVPDFSQHLLWHSSGTSPIEAWRFEDSLGNMQSACRLPMLAAHRREDWSNKPSPVLLRMICLWPPSKFLEGAPAEIAFAGTALELKCVLHRILSFCQVQALTSLQPYQTCQNAPKTSPCRRDGLRLLHRN